MKFGGTGIWYISNYHWERVIYLLIELDWTCFSGVNCTEDVNLCEKDHDCGENGQCVDETEGFSCQCSEGFTGDTCEQVYNLCEDDNPCQNGASCQSSGECFFLVFFSSSLRKQYWNKSMLLIWYIDWVAKRLKTDFIIEFINGFWSKFDACLLQIFPSSNIQESWWALSKKSLGNQKIIVLI